MEWWEYLIWSIEMELQQLIGTCSPFGGMSFNIGMEMYLLYFVEIASM